VSDGVWEKSVRRDEDGEKDSWTQRDFDPGHKDMNRHGYEQGGWNMYCVLVIACT
jgi:hypothetical protein